MAGRELEMLQEAFYNFDEDCDWLLSLSDLRDICTRQGEGMHDVEDFLAEASKFDTGGGMIDYRQLAQLMLSAE